MKKFFGILFCAALLFNIVSAQITPSKTYVISDPKPNMKENYVPLKLAKIVGPEVGPDVFLFKPRSLTLDREGNLYVFDRAQSKIIKMDKNLKFVRYIGKEGSGPGEFKNGIGVVFINIGPDNKLYVNDTLPQKMSVFDTDGNYLAEYPMFRRLVQKPMVDRKGNCYYFAGDDTRINAVNQNGDTVLNIPVKAEEVYSFLFHRQFLPKQQLSRFFVHSFLDPDHLLLYFANSSTMLKISNGKIVQTTQILPEDLLHDYGKALKTNCAKNEKFSYKIFSRIIPDWDEPEIYYLPFICNETLNRSLLYRMNGNGKLQKTLYVDYTQVTPYTCISKGNQCIACY